VRAVIAVRPGFVVTSADVEQACLDQIATYKRPRSVEFVDELPKTGSGKIKRQEIRRRYWADQQRRVGG
jgi:acyl-CoA synthetase (AMP-forming)/AMP-acid ligase II